MSCFYLNIGYVLEVNLFFQSTNISQRKLWAWVNNVCCRALKTWLSLALCHSAPLHKLICLHKIPLLPCLFLSHHSTAELIPVPTQSSPLKMAEAKDNSDIFRYFQEQVWLSLLSPSKYMSMSSLYSRMPKGKVCFVDSKGKSVSFIFLFWYH